MSIFACLSKPRAVIDWMPARVGVALLTMFGLINALMVRVNLSVAIVSMVRRNLTSISQTQTQCSPQIDNTSVTTLHDSPTTVATTQEDGQAFTLSPALLADSENGGMEGELDLDEITQGNVLAAFFYGYWVTQVIGGRMAEVYGTRIVLGVSVFAGGVSAILTPMAARTHYIVLVVLRVVQGLFQGATLPCLFPLMVRWIPPFERSRFIAYVLFCNNLSISVTWLLCGIVIKALGWDAAFYVTGALSLLWCCIWFSCMYETPSQHPRISKEELAYIKESPDVCDSTQGKKPVPWIELTRSLPVWAILLCEGGNSYGFSVYSTYIPTYMNNILGFDIQQNGFLSALPFLCRYLGAVMAATIGEKLLSRRMLSIVTIRRIFSAFAMFGPAINLLVVSYSGCDAFTVIVLLCLGFFFNGSITIGLFANRTDITSNYSGTLSGLANGFANVVAIIVPLIVGFITQNQQTLGQWQKVFWSCVPVYVLCEVFYVIFVSGSIQQWDTSNVEEDVEEDTKSITKDEMDDDD